MTKDIETRLGNAFASALKAEFGAILGEILSDAAGYFPRVGLGVAALKQMRDANAKVIEGLIPSSTVDGGIMLLVRSNAIASGILVEIDEIRHWAGVGCDLCQRVDGGGWDQAEPEFRWMLENPEEYSELVRGVKRFLGQLH